MIFSQFPHPSQEKKRSRKSASASQTCLRQVGGASSKALADAERCHEHQIHGQGASVFNFKPELGKPQSSTATLASSRVSRQVPVPALPLPLSPHEETIPSARYSDGGVSTERSIVRSKSALLAQGLSAYRKQEPRVQSKRALDLRFCPRLPKGWQQVLSLSSQASQPSGVAADRVLDVDRCAAERTCGEFPSARARASERLGSAAALACNAFDNERAMEHTTEKRRGDRNEPSPLKEPFNVSPLELRGISIRSAVSNQHINSEAALPISPLFNLPAHQQRFSNCGGALPQSTREQRKPSAHADCGQLPRIRLNLSGVRGIGGAPSTMRERERRHSQSNPNLAS